MGCVATSRETLEPNDRNGLKRIQFVDINGRWKTIRLGKQTKKDAEEAGKNFRTRFAKLIAKAGVKPWPKLFHNLRASCETDLAKTHPI